MSSLVTRPSYIRERMKDAGIVPSKSLGQNFLCDGNILDLIIREADIQPDEHVLEIGPGLGALTVSLLRYAGKVTAIEKDETLAKLLQQEMSTRSNFHLRIGDALDIDINELMSSGIQKVVSNLPYSVGTRIAMELLQAHALPERMLFMLQKDVAEKFAASPGSKTYGLTAVWSQIEYRVDVVHTVSPRCFIPPPRIASAVLRLIRRTDERPVIQDRDLFNHLTRYAFEHRRKQMATILGSFSGFAGNREQAETLLNDVHLKGEQRPETLAPHHWVEISNRIFSMLSAPK